MEIIERSSALKMGLKTYYTGRLCAKGHLAYRYTASGTCSECINGPKSLDLRTGLPPESRVIEQRMREGRDAETQARAEFLRHEHAAEMEAARKAAEMEAARKAEREAALPHIAGDRYLICDDADWMLVRSLVLMETRVIYPSLTDEDICPLQGIKRWTPVVARHTIHTTQTLWELFKAMCDAMLKKRQPADLIKPTYGRLTRNDLRRWLGMIGDEIWFTGEPAPFRARTKDVEQAVNFDGYWYRWYEVEALMREQREAIEPIEGQ